MPSPGTYELREVTIEEAKEFAKDHRLKSAVGHKGTAEFLSEVLGVPIKFIRINIRMEVGDEILGFQLEKRQPMGIDLSTTQLKHKKWKLGIIKRIK